MKQLRAEKDRESAATVAAIRRPAWPEWALNVTSQAHPEEIEAFAQAAGAVRQAQEAALEGQPADVRATLNELRQRTAALVNLANGVSLAEGRHGDLPEVQAQLSEIAGNADAVERLRGGTLGTGEAGGSPLFAGLPLAEPRPEAVPSVAPTTATGAAQGRAGRVTDPPAQPAAERRRLMRELATADRDHKRSERQVRRAEEELAEAADAAARAEHRLSAARDRLAEATAAAQRDEAARNAAASALEATS